MVNLVVAGSLIVSLAGAPAPAADDPPAGGRLVIDVVTVNGSGCRPGTAAVGMSADNRFFTVTYSEYMVQVGTGGKKHEKKKCKLDLVVRVPPGYTYAIAQVDYRGFAHLEPGATGLQTTSYHFQGQSQPVNTDHPFAGPLDDDWTTTDVTALVYATCGKVRTLNIDTEITANIGTADPATTSVLAMDSTDGSLTTTYRFAWKRCA